MKVFFLSLLTGFIFFAATCDREKTQEQMQLKGIIENQGITSYQYGTHVLNSEEDFYALKSEKLNLENFVGKMVLLSGSKIEGYPVDGGPDYILVTEVKKQ